MELIGWIGSLLFAFSAVPQAWQSYRQGHSRGISNGFLALWTVGEVLTLLYVLIKVGSAPLIVNYICNFICLLVIVKYKFWERDLCSKSEIKSE